MRMCLFLRFLALALPSSVAPFFTLFPSICPAALLTHSYSDSRGSARLHPKKNNNRLSSLLAWAAAACAMEPQPHQQMRCLHQILSSSDGSRRARQRTPPSTPPCRVVKAAAAVTAVTATVTTVAIAVVATTVAVAAGVPLGRGPHDNALPKRSEPRKSRKLPLDGLYREEQRVKWGGMRGRNSSQTKK